MLILKKHLLIDNGMQALFSIGGQSNANDSQARNSPFNFGHTPNITGFAQVCFYWLCSHAHLPHTPLKQD